MRRAADVLLWVGAVLGALSLVAALLVGLLGLVPLIFTSGSMAPEIPSGSLGVARSVPAAELRVDDVVSVESAEGTRVTHRIVSMQETENGALLTLKGDANEEPDTEPYPVTDADRLLFSVPWVGHVLSALANPLALFGAGVLAAGVLFAMLSPARRSGGTRRADRSDRPEGDRTSGRGRRVAAGVLVAALPAVVVLQPAQPTMAAFSDAGATVTTTGFVAHRVGQPTDITCSASGSVLTVGTTAVDARYTYWAQAFTPGVNGTSISALKQMTGTGATRTVGFGTGEFSPTLVDGANYEMRVYARVANTSWLSRTYTVQAFSRTSGVMACGTAPVLPTITFGVPVNGGSYTDASLVTALNTGCVANSAACGTVSDDGSVTRVDYILQRSSLLLGTRCWDGASWVTSCVYRQGGLSTTSPQRWSVPRTSATYSTVFGATYTLTIRATDNQGLVTVRTIQYTA